MKSLIRSDLEHLVTAMTPGGIEASEAQGQRALCHESSRLPRDINDRVTWEDIEREWGIKRGEVVDEIFYSVNLPEGWKLQPTDHSMWNDLVDSAGRTRANIFFKAAFYDFNSHMHLCRRYGFKFESDGPDKKCRNLVVDNQTAEVLFTGPWADYSESYKEPKEFLSKEFPDHDDPFAYWAA